MGFTALYNDDPDFALKAKIVLPLAFVTVNNLDEYVDELANELPPELQPVLGWFENTYFGRPNRLGRGRRPSLFPPTRILYEVMFGTPQQNALLDASLDNYIVNKIETEEHLENHLILLKQSLEKANAICEKTDSVIFEAELENDTQDNEKEKRLMIENGEIE
ncbi:hypothetical protein ILUMI_03242 [Ignelater luminosus]|uniref:Uncharacterized protein n=1 Tax=Ignelater luminosus TaxID=2038154 RepID=A0A8K0DG59_IGNLU|nr:hypothetical protein ILUMI_03242 [Ignelater luminosus]